MTALPVAARMLAICSLLCATHLAASAPATAIAPAPFAPYDLLRVGITDLTGPDVTTNWDVRADAPGPHPAACLIGLVGSKSCPVRNPRPSNDAPPPAEP